MERLGARATSLRPRWPALVAAWCAPAVIGCGSLGSSSRSCSPVSTPRPPEVSGAGVTAVADRGTVAPGATVTFTVVARGQSRFTAPCSGPLQLLVADTAQLSVYSTASAAGPASPCGPVALAVGGRAVYSVAWPVDATLPGGRYDATLVLGDIPALRLAITVAPAHAPC